MHRRPTRGQRLQGPYPACLPSCRRLPPSARPELRARVLAADRRVVPAATQDRPRAQGLQAHQDPQGSRARSPPVHETRHRRPRQSLHHRRLHRPGSHRLPRRYSIPATSTNAPPAQPGRKEFDLFAKMGSDTKFIVQAKLYTKTVLPTHVRDLYGTVQHKGATKCIMITTSGYGPEPQFAGGKPLSLIDGAGL
ncbi:restriction endonuclease [Nonomuraea rubra]|uniref:restriction endonuclease n=1 Tax=Nonomuraea rubra TaxID=46180 RepID=UPI0034095C6E